MLTPQCGRIADVCAALVGAAERGKDPRTQIAALRTIAIELETEVARAVGQTLERLAGPFALVEALDIAGVVLGVNVAEASKPKKRVRLTPETRAEVARLLAEGLTQSEVAERLGVAQATVSRVAQSSIRQIA